MVCSAGIPFALALLVPLRLFPPLPFLPRDTPQAQRPHRFE